MVHAQPDIRVQLAMSLVRHRQFLKPETAVASSESHGAAAAEAEHRDHSD
jgi:hypothetical protein